MIFRARAVFSIGFSILLAGLACSATRASASPGHIAFGDSPGFCTLDKNNSQSPYLSAKIEFFVSAGQAIPQHGGITALAWITGIEKSDAISAGTLGQFQQLGAFVGALSKDGFVSNTDQVRFSVSFVSDEQAPVAILKGKDRNGKWSSAVFPGGQCEFYQGSVGAHNRGAE